MADSENKAFVRVENVHKSFKTGKLETPVLKGANMDIAENSFIVIFGPSGCGKTTLLNLLGALDRTNSGNVWVDGVNLSKADTSRLAEVRREKVGFVFQFYNLISNLTALENIEIGLEAMGLQGDAVRRQALCYLEKVGLEKKADKFTEQLSGGEQQRIAIARALAKEPKLILADEPTGNLDEDNSIKIGELMAKLHKELGTTFIIATHNQKLAQIASKIYHISKGSISMS